MVIPATPVPTSSHIKYRKGYKYQLGETYFHQTDIKGYSCKTEFIHLHKNGLLEIKAGYAWDGPSGPTIDTKNFMRSSLVHDALYQLMREGLLPTKFRDDADELLRTISIEDGINSVRAWFVYFAVRLEGEQFATPGKDKEVIIAP